MLVCSDCKKQIEFYKNKSRKLCGACYKRFNYSKNRKKILAANRKWKLLNKDKIKNIEKSYYEENKEIVLARQKEYQIGLKF